MRYQDPGAGYQLGAATGRGGTEVRYDVMGLVYRKWKKRNGIREEVCFCGRKLHAGAFSAEGKSKMYIRLEKGSSGIWALCDTIALYVE